MRWPRRGSAGGFRMRPLVRERERESGGASMAEGGEPISTFQALCSERYRDWTAKLDPIGIKCKQS